MALRWFLPCLLAASSLPAPGQKLDPVQWSLTLAPAAAPPGSTVLGHLTAKVQAGWHLYSLSTPKGGPNPTTIALLPNDAVAAVKLYQPKPEQEFDQGFNLNTEIFDNTVDFVLEITLKKDTKPGTEDLAALVRYQVCQATLCLPPKRKTASATLTVNPQAPAPAAAIPAGYLAYDALPAAAAPAPKPPVKPMPQQEDLGPFLLVAFGFGLAALFTPCCFPMVPITMSFFLNRKSNSRADALFHAVLFCLGIVVLFTSIGLVVTAVLGPFGVVQLGSNPWVNLFVALVFFLLSLSLLGAFEISLPSRLLTRLDRASQRGGIAGTLLMGLTFSLTSFACVGPFVGSLLAASMQGGGVKPLLGMVAFAGGLSLPFFFLALFPAFLKRLPKSGGWLVRVKVVLGFVLLAVMLKYLLNVDSVMQWNFMTRERFLAAWIVLFALPGLYLLGLLRLEGVKPDEPLGIGRLLVASFFLVFACSLLPGMFGANLGAIEAYIPQPAQHAVLGGSSSELSWMKNQYREALNQAREQDKLVLVSFTGYACTNCHWMKANLFPLPEVAAALDKFVRVELYTDGTDAASRSNQALEERMFSTVAIPYYAIMDPGGQVIRSFPGATRNAREFLAFLRKR